MPLALTEQVHRALEQSLRPGDVAVDATLGNGHDALFIAQTIGESGKLFGFDIQHEAIQATQQRLRESGLHHFQLFPVCHARMREFVPLELHGQIAAILFNLGYLPGANKAVTTQAETTRMAIEAAMQLLRGGGVLSVVAYPGHLAGAIEAEMVQTIMNARAADDFEIECRDSQGGSKPGPIWWWAKKRPIS